MLLRISKFKTGKHQQKRLRVIQLEHIFIGFLLWKKLKTGHCQSEINKIQLRGYSFTKN